VVTGRSDEPRLPAPSPTALEHSRALTRRIQREIDAAGGAIRFSRFQELALYAPGLGYYSAGATRFGEAGDFVTAPEISPLFSRCVARACAPVLQDLGGGVIVELGAGSGRMAADMLAELAALGHAPAQYLILEVSADLRQRQAATLERLAPRQASAVRWLEQVPTGIEGVIVGNEVLDALPVERFTIAADGARYLGVSRDADGFRWQPLPGDAALEQRLADLERLLGAPLPVGYTSEYCPALHDWTAAVAAGLERGLLLLIDYGLPRRELYRAERSAGTLRCHYRHRAHDDPFFCPGLQDITAWVDFTAVAEAATGAGLTLDGFTTQAGFLIGAGLLSMLDPNGAAGRKAIVQSRQVGQLVLPGHMGERCRVIAFSRDWPGTLPGLTAPDLSGSL
jgi:SAM-dependent MidA family methyltransferase